MKTTAYVVTWSYKDFSSWGILRAFLVRSDAEEYSKEIQSVSDREIRVVEVILKGGF